MSLTTTLSSTSLPGLSYSGASTNDGSVQALPHCINPAQMSQQSSQAGPSNGHGIVKPKKTPSIKRRRTGSPEGDALGGTPTPQKKNRDGPRKKKANRACFHCQKAHLTCDDSRPCQRCVKRGMADSCTEGHRKKAKYLLDEDELDQLKRSKSSAPEDDSESPSVEARRPMQNQALVPLQTSEPFATNDPLFNVSYDANFPFGSEAANLEYSILSAILGNPSPPESAPTPPSEQLAYPTTTMNPAWPNDSMQFVQPPTMTDNGYNSSYIDSSMSVQPSDTTLSPQSSAQISPAFMGSYPTYTTSGQQIPQDQQRMQYESPYGRPQQPHLQRIAPQPAQPLDRYGREMRSSPGAFIGRSSSKDGIARVLGSPSPSNSPASSASMNPSYIEGLQTLPGSQGQKIDARVTRPYDYTEGYHFLMKHLPTRFEKNDILRIVRALAIFRPSLIAMQMPLTEEDEVFVEKCFQRSLLELDKLISFNGTPTVVWRRTGEICLVAPEFCMLTEWSMEDLVGQRKYVYELFENQSVVEYYENFAEHAFENTTQSVYSHCVLLKPSGAPIPATFCFSIRRDIYDLPSLVIGQWLPLL